jgi:hypothetical protein
MMESVMDSLMVTRHADHRAVLHRHHHREGMTRPHTYGVPDGFPCSPQQSPWVTQGWQGPVRVLVEGLPA